MTALTTTRGERPAEPAATPPLDGFVGFEDHTEELRPLVTRPSAAVPLPLGTRLNGRYVLESQIGAGGNCLVYCALDLLDAAAPKAAGVPIAVKMLRPELRHREESIARLKHEYRQALTLDHPNIPRIFDLDCDQGTWFITMELLEGETLAATLRRTHTAPLPQEVIRRVTAACVAALGHAHARGIAHGDVKPGNVFLSRDGSVRLLDFGIGSSAEPGSVPPAATRAYASPEVLAGAAPEPRDDIFSLSCVIYEMCTGLHPFSRCASIAAARTGMQAPRPSDMPEGQWLRLQAGMAWHRADRPASVAALLSPEPSREPAPPPRLVHSARPALPPTPPRPVARPQAAVRAQRNAHAGERASRYMVVGAIALTLAFAFVAWVSQQRTKAPPPPRSVAANPAPPVAPPLAPPAPAAAVTAAPTTTPAPERSAAARPPALIGFDAAEITVNEGTNAAALTLRRLDNAPRRAKVRWQIEPASAAAGSDFTSPISGTVTLAEDLDRRVIYLPLIDDAEREGTEQFSVVLTPADRSTKISGTNRITVTIVDND